MAEPSEENARTLEEYQRLLELDTRGAAQRQDLRDRIQAKSLEHMDAVMGQVNEQQAIEIARKIIADPTQ